MEMTFSILNILRPVHALQKNLETKTISMQHKPWFSKLSTKRVEINILDVNDEFKMHVHVNMYITYTYISIRCDNDENDNKLDARDDKCGMMWVYGF